MTAPHPYASFVHRVERPARYVGGEYGAIVKDPRAGAVSATIALCFPDVYEIGMSHLGYKILYSLLNRDPRIAAERCYAPWPDMEKELRARGLALVTLETARPLSEFDVVGFSLQFELTYTNVLTMLDLGGIALRSSARSERDPIVIAGGPTATHPEAMAPFFDAIFVGEGEREIGPLVLDVAAWRRAGLPRAEILARIDARGPLYVPSLHPTRVDPVTGFSVLDTPIAVRRALVERIEDYPFPADGPVPSTEAVFDRVSIEVARGCTEGCRFCQAGMIYRPVRERPPRQVIDALVTSLDRGGYDEGSLTSLSTADYSCVTPLVHEAARRVVERKVALSVSSLRAYGLSEQTLDDLSEVRASGLTFAPEAGTQRMRDVISKNVTEEQMMQTAERVFSRGWRKMKLYFMIGLPTETDDDVVGIVETGKKALAIGRRLLRGTRPTVTVSVSTHVPKPHAPFQWAAMDPIGEVERKHALLRDRARGSGLDLRLHDPTGSLLEGVLGRGDRRVADAVERAWQKGCRFDSWEEHLRVDRWMQAFAETGIDPYRYLCTIPLDARLPWDHVDVGLAEGFLAQEYKKALKGRLSPPCGKPFSTFVHATNLRDAEADTKKLVCYDCGVACDLGHMREERKEFLRALGAIEGSDGQLVPLRIIPPAPTAADLEPRASGGSARPVPKVRFAQRRSEPIRVRFEKTGPAVLLGHLDLVRTIPRIVRRAGYAMFYSEGFHPKPKLILGPALPVGTASVAEYADLMLAEDVAAIDVGTFVERLNAAAPDGIRFVAARGLAQGEAALTRRIDRANYLAALPRARIGAIDLDAACRALLDRGEIAGRRKDRTIDARRWLVDVAPAGDSAAALGKAGVVGDLAAVAITVAVGGDGAGRPSDYLVALLGALADETLVVRTALYRATEGPGASPLDPPPVPRATTAAGLAAESNPA